MLPRLCRGKQTFPADDDVRIELVCLALTLALFFLAARIASIW